MSTTEKLAAEIKQRVGADGVFLILMGLPDKTTFAVDAADELQAKLPRMLRDFANLIEAKRKKAEPLGEPLPPDGDETGAMGA